MHFFYCIPVQVTTVMIGIVLTLTLMTVTSKEYKVQVYNSFEVALPLNSIEDKSMTHHHQLYRILCPSSHTFSFQ